MRRSITAAATVVVAAGLALDGVNVIASAAPVPPATVILDGARLVAIKQQLATSPTREQTAALAALKRAADRALTAGPWSVMQKTSTVSADKHDYYSLATYFWPNPDTPDGCPAVRKDGRWGPAVASTGDLTARALSWQAISDLALAWFYTGNAAYARRARLDIRTWFLNSSTRMNPNMNFGQVVPCTKVGRKEGIIESAEAITQVLDALAILDTGAPGWTTGDHDGMVRWLTRFLSWMRTSTIGKAESAATNNHGTWKDLQDAAIMLYIGQKANAKTLVQSVRANRIAKQIAGDGTQPKELERTRPWHYVNFNLQAFIRLAELGRHVQVNLWSYTAPNGATLAKAVDALIAPAEQGPSAFPFPDLDVFDRSLAQDKLHAAAAEAGDRKAQAALALVPAPAGGDLWPVQPVCWRDDSGPPVQKPSQVS